MSEKTIFWIRTMSAVRRLADETGKPRKGGMPAGDGVVSES